MCGWQVKLCYTLLTSAISERVTDEQLIIKLYTNKASFSAIVNSRSRSLYAVARPSVVCLSSVTFVHPTQPVEILANVSTPFGTLATL